MREVRPWPARAACLLTTLAALVAGCGGDGDDSGPSGSAGDGERPPGATQQDDGQGGANSTVELYFTEGEQLATVERPLGAGADSPEEAVKALLAGPPGADVETEIPPATTLRDVEVRQGEAIVRVSEEFLAGVPRRPARRSATERQELNARLAQVAFTVSGVRDLDVRVVAGDRVVSDGLKRVDFAKPDRGPREVKRAPRRGVSGTRRIQERLADLGYLPRSAVDGIYGYQTEQAVMALQAWEGIGRDGVVGPITRAALADARRPRPRPAKAPRRIEVYREKGVALLIRRGRTVRAIHVSTGAPGTSTPTGTYRVFRKELQSWSVPFSVWLPYASYFNQGIAFHEYPDVPPYPASHGCVRVPAPEAKRVYEFARLETVVKVF